METEYHPELPSDRLVRRWYRTALYIPGLLCLALGSVALMDGRAGVAAAGAALGVAWALVARLIWPR